MPSRKQVRALERAFYFRGLSAVARQEALHLEPGSPEFLARKLDAVTFDYLNHCELEKAGHHFSPWLKDRGHRVICLLLAVLSYRDSEVVH